MPQAHDRFPKPSQTLDQSNSNSGEFQVYSIHEPAHDSYSHIIASFECMKHESIIAKLKKIYFWNTCIFEITPSCVQAKKWH